MSELGQRQGVLDVGTGTGRLCLPLAQAGHHVVGLDFAPAMLDRARAITAKAGVAERCEFVEGDLLTGVTPGLAGRRFDAVAVLGVLDYISDPLPLLRTSLSFRPKRIIASFPRADTLRSGLRRLRYRIQGLDCPLFFYTRTQVSRLADELGAPRSRVDLMGQLHLACFDFER